MESGKENDIQTKESVDKNVDEEEFIKNGLKFAEEKYLIQEKIGEGTFSVVYKAVCRESGMNVAIKAITRTSAPLRILDELKILKTLGGEQYCIPLIDVLKNGDQVIAVFPYVKNIDFKDFIKESGPKDIQYYMHCLLKAVAHVHSHGYIHRDIKPTNFIFDLKNSFGFLIDFGLIQKESKQHKEQPAKTETPILFFKTTIKPSRPPGYFENDSRPVMRAPRAGTRGFRAPEVLFKSTNQTKAIDIWSVGVLFLCILTHQYPFFLSMEDIDGLVEIAQIFGHNEMRKAAKIHGRVWKSNIKEIKEEKTSFRELVDEFNPNGFVSDEAVDLLGKMLELNPEKRITAKDALKHSYFNK